MVSLSLIFPLNLEIEIIGFVFVMFIHVSYSEILPLLQVLP